MPTSGCCSARSRFADRPEVSDETIRDRLAEHGIRCTRQREQIYRALVLSRCHPTAEELHAELRDGTDGLSLATVYNTLDVLTRSGLVRRIPPSRGGAGGPSRYEADMRDHVHLVHEDGSVQDLPADLSEALLACISPDVRVRIERAMGVRIDRMNVEFSVKPGRGR